MSDAPPPSPALVVSGESPLGETRGAVLTRAGNRRILGPWRWLPVAILLALLALYLAAIGGLIQYNAPWWAIIPLAVALFASILVGMRIAQRVITRVVLRGWQARGLPAVNRLSYAIEDDALVISGAASTTRLRWAYVGELVPAGKAYWVMPAAGLFYYLPRRFFASQDAEAEFLNAMFARMTPDARARSAEARKLAAFV